MHHAAFSVLCRLVVKIRTVLVLVILIAAVLVVVLVSVLVVVLASVLVIVLGIILIVVLVILIAHDTLHFSAHTLIKTGRIQCAGLTSAFIRGCTAYVFLLCLHL